MKVGYLVLVVVCLMALTGCESVPETSLIAVRLGMSREQLKSRYGEPSRVEPAASGGEDWYYRFLAWKHRPTEETGTSVGSGGTSSYSSVSVESWKETEERPIHISPDGFVIAPLPDGKIVKN